MYRIEILFITIVLLSISCKEKSEKAIHKPHNPSENICQYIQDDEAERLYAKGQDYLEYGDYINAKKLLIEAANIEMSPIIINELGLLEFNQKNYLEAIKFYKEARKIDSTYWPTYTNEAIIHGILSEFDKGERLLAKLKKECNTPYWIQFADLLLGIFYFNQKQDCDKIYLQLEKAKGIILLDDVKRKHYYELKAKADFKCDSQETQ